MQKSDPAMSNMRLPKLLKIAIFVRTGEYNDMPAMSCSPVLEKRVSASGLMTRIPIRRSAQSDSIISNEPFSCAVENAIISTC